MPDHADCPGCGRIDLPVRPGLLAPVPVAHVREAPGSDARTDGPPRWVPCTSGPYAGTTTGAAMREGAMDRILGRTVGPSSPVDWDLPDGPPGGMFRAVLEDARARVESRLEECGHCHTLTGDGISHLYVCPGPAS